jgi:hypothetical protein
MSNWHPFTMTNGAKIFVNLDQAFEITTFGAVSHIKIANGPVTTVIVTESADQIYKLAEQSHS